MQSHWQNADVSDDLKESLSHARQWKARRQGRGDPRSAAGRRSNCVVGAWPQDRAVAAGDVRTPSASRGGSRPSISLDSNILDGTMHIWEWPRPSSTTSTFALAHVSVTCAPSV